MKIFDHSVESISIYNESYHIEYSQENTIYDSFFSSSSNARLSYDSVCNLIISSVSKSQSFIYSGSNQTFWIRLVLYIN